MTQARSDEPFLRIAPAEARALITKGVQVVDVREPQEYAEVRIPGSTLVPLGTLLKSPREVLGKGAVLFVCSEGIRSAVASEAAAAIGLDEVYNLEGGTQRWQAEGFPVESGRPDEPIVTQVPERPSAGPTAGFLQSGERLVRVHRFRYLRAVACALGTLDLVVEESLDGVNDPAKRCVARPDHPERVARPELTVFGESVEDALRTLIDHLRGRRPPDIFLPTE
ncbi:MAG TPA: rhodanese-like domain-containing protein [Candidatus Methylomirabilis sp.]|nr:rhodanese-like domain-containing protein [Candidatus Methylomirabilis sp.]